MIAMRTLFGGGELFVRSVDVPGDRTPCITIFPKKKKKKKKDNLNFL